VETHPFYHLSGVAVAYKLVEAMYITLPDIPRKPLENLLDLVAIGLIADLVKLTGECRYLAQKGIQKLQNTQRLGVKKLLDLCNKTGDRPLDISFGIGPRINAVSRIYGDARFCVELLTSEDEKRCHELAEQAELANIRRQEIQRDIIKQVQKKLEGIDLSTTNVIILDDPQWNFRISCGTNCPRIPATDNFIKYQ
jgi:single-stranded-DNA-specific exonuclease